MHDNEFTRDGIRLIMFANFTYAGMEGLHAIYQSQLGAVSGVDELLIVFRGGYRGQSKLQSMCDVQAKVWKYP